MEHTILASVTSILIGFVVMDNQSNEEVVRRFLRDGKFSGMVETLMQYYEFMNLTVSVSFLISKLVDQSFNKFVSFLVRSLIDCPTEDDQKRDRLLAQLRHRLRRTPTIILLLVYKEPCVAFNSSRPDNVFF